MSQPVENCADLNKTDKITVDQSAFAINAEEDTDDVD